MNFIFETYPKKIKDGLKTDTIPDYIPIIPFTKKLIQKQYGEMISFLISKNNKLIFESYYNDNNSDRLHHIFSVTKNILSLLVGRAIELNILKLSDLNLSIVDFFPSVNKKIISNWQHSTLHDSLNMTSGVKTNKESVEKLKERGLNSHEFVERAFAYSNPPSLDKSKRHFCYQQSDPTFVALILNEKLKGKMKEFAKSFFEDLNIFNYKWTEGPCGILKGDAHAYLTARDLIKIGNLVLNQGKLQEKQFINKDFLQKSISPIYKVNPQRFYGYYWWIENFLIRNQPITEISARGHKGNYIFIYPELNLQFVLNGNNSKMGINPMNLKNGSNLFKDLRNDILAYFL